VARRKSLWRLWAKALGEKDGRTDREADIIASIRTVILICYMVTNVAIVANALRHWNNVNSNCSQGHTTQVGSHVSGTASSKEI
jgi:putative effector of murein hydrolase